MGKRGTRRRQWFVRALLAIIAVTGLGLGAIVLHPGVLSALSADLLPGFSLSEQAVSELIKSWGAWGVLGSIGLMILHSFVPFPAEILALANGMVYGALWGAVITWVGAMLGAYLAFGLARLLGQPFVRRMVAKERWDSIERWSRSRGGVALLLARCVPVIAFNLINYAAGLTGISWWTFTWATAIGIIPLTVLLAVLGDRMSLLPWWVWLAVVMGAALAWFGLSRLSRARADAGRGLKRSGPGDARR